MEFEQRVAQLRETIDKTSFNFKFEDLFTEEEWTKMEIAQRKRLEKSFRSFVSKHNYLRIPYTSEDKIRLSIFNIEYSYNEVKENFSAYV
ncbi:MULTISPECIES: DUF1413 domain-containing protein [Staphylococcus]|uniref:DUF1413 domain-containing protein n=1 Tax=Staphylococcus hsinchuensis TaxID=3051183 RepID=A0ABZ3EDG9_9STAP|nr:MULTISPECIES: DUF1413 domain-containing protein [unclassified Staphylococcus]